MLRISRATHTLSKWTQLQGSIVGDMKGFAGKSERKERSIPTSSPLSDMQAKMRKMLDNVPADVQPMERAEKAIKDPLWRCVDWEVEEGRALLTRIRVDLELLYEFCTGAAKATNELRALAQTMSTHTVPSEWKVPIVLCPWSLGARLSASKIEKVRRFSAFHVEVCFDWEIDVWMNGW